MQTINISKRKKKGGRPCARLLHSPPAAAAAAAAADELPHIEAAVGRKSACACVREEEGGRRGGGGKGVRGLLREAEKRVGWALRRPNAHIVAPDQEVAQPPRECPIHPLLRPAQLKVHVGVCRDELACALGRKGGEGGVGRRG
jgi:hypothetical protein